MFGFENEQAYDDQYQYKAARTEKNLRRITNAAPGQSTIPSS